MRGTKVASQITVRSSAGRVEKVLRFVKAMDRGGGSAGEKLEVVKVRVDPGHILYARISDPQ
jgi:hypothetical protein